MITIKDTHFTSDVSLASMLMVRTKERMLDIGKKLGLYVSPNLKKDETVHRIARGILAPPCRIVQPEQKRAAFVERVCAGRAKPIHRQKDAQDPIQVTEILLGTDLRGFRHQRMENADAG